MQNRLQVSGHVVSPGNRFHWHVMRNNIRVAIRFDDPSATSHRGIDVGVLSALGDAGLMATIALIPFVRDQTGSHPFDAINGAHILNAHKRGVIEVALHGHSHSSLNSGKHLSELASLSFEDQAAMLTAATGHLRAIFGSDAVRGFVPPWNSYDAATLRALERLGFDYISAGDYHPPKYNGPLIAIPRTCQFVELESVISEMRKYSRFNPHLIAVMHHYDFHESGHNKSSMDLRGFASKLAWLAKQSDIEIMTIRGMVNASGSDVLNRISRRWFDAARLHWRLKERLPRHALLDAPTWRLLLA